MMGLLLQAGMWALPLLLQYIVYVCINRLYFHPLAGVPGPKIAAVTRLYEAYYNLWQDGQYLFKTQELHKIYGPIVRISPNEVSINDPDFYDKVYYVGSKFSKDPSFYRGFAVDHSMLATQSNSVHSTKRAPFNQFFSRRNILTLESSVRHTIGKLCARIDKASQAGTPLDVLHGSKAVSIDVITGFAFDFSFDLLEREDLGKAFCQEQEKRLGSHWVVMYFPWWHKIMQRLPGWVLMRWQPGIKAMMDLKDRCRETIRRIRADDESMTPRETIFHHLLNSEHTYKGPKLSNPAMIAEGVILVGAATDTVGSALTTTVFGILSNSSISARLRTELLAAFPEPTEELSFQKLEALPYLTAVLKEGLRKSPGIIGRLPRLAPPGGIGYGRYHLPEGTSVSMCAHYAHFSPTAFPDPEKFDPERWIGPGARAVEKYFVPFSRGSRACLGINLAWCELYLTVGSIFRRYELRVAGGTGEEDIKPTRDYFIGYPKKGARGFSVFSERRVE